MVHRRGTLQLKESDLFYEVTGEGPGLVFLHGLGGNYLSWWQQVPFFSDRYTCITFSHRGFWPSKVIPASVGASEFADDLAALLDHLNMKDALFVAQSMGGWTGLEFALRFPERVRGLVMSSSTGSMDLNALGGSDAKALTEWRARSDQAKKELQRDSILPATGRRLAVEQPSLYYLYHRLNGLTPLPFRDSVRKKIHEERTKPLEEIMDLKAPVLFVAGEEDIVFPPVAASALTARMPNARYHPISLAGHSTYFERPLEYNMAVESFLRTIRHST